MKSEIAGGNIKRRKAWVTKRCVLKHSLCQGVTETGYCDLFS